MAACEWILYNNETLGEYRCIPLYDRGCCQIHHKTLKHCSFFGTETEAKADVKKREYEDGLTYRGGPRAAIGHPSYHKRGI